MIWKPVHYKVIQMRTRVCRTELLKILTRIRIEIGHCHLWPNFETLGHVPKFSFMVDAVRLVFKIPVSTDFVEESRTIYKRYCLLSVALTTASCTFFITLPQELSLRKLTRDYFTSLQVVEFLITLIYFSRSKPWAVLMVPVRLQVETTAALRRLLNFDTCVTNKYN